MTMHKKDASREQEHFGAALDQRADVLVEELRTAAAELPGARSSDNTERERAPASDAVDVADERLQNGLRFAEAERDMTELRDIEAARARLANGEFGRCVDCGIDIPRARLEALPAAARCIECQSRYEERHPAEVRLPPDL